jgi:hypothetical protein
VLTLAIRTSLKSPFYPATDKPLSVKNGLDGGQELTSDVCLEDISSRSVAQSCLYYFDFAILR